MLEYQKDWIVKGDSVIDSYSLGEVTLERMNGLPFYTFEQDGEKIMDHDEQKCGGDCFDFLKSKIEMTWEQTYSKNSTVVETKSFEAVECSHSDVGAVLAVCPPKESLEMVGLPGTYPIK